MVDTVGDFEQALARTLADLGAAAGRPRVHRAHRRPRQHAPAHADARARGRRARPARRRRGRTTSATTRRSTAGTPTSTPACAKAWRAMRARGWRLACVTNKPRAFALALLEAKGLLPLFEHVFGGDSFERHKPDPLPLIKTCEALGTPPARTLMVGDSRNDCEAGARRGLPGGAGELRLQPRRAGGRGAARSRDRPARRAGLRPRARHEKAARGPPSHRRAGLQVSRLNARSTSAVWPLGVGLKRHWRTASTAAAFRLGLVVFITVTTSTTPSGPDLELHLDLALAQAAHRGDRELRVGRLDHDQARIRLFLRGRARRSAAPTAAGAASEPATPADETPASTPPVRHRAGVAGAGGAGGGGQRRRGGGRRGGDDRRRRGVGGIGGVGATTGVGRGGGDLHAFGRAAALACGAGAGAGAAATGLGAAAGLGAGVAASTRIQYIVRSVSFCASFGGGGGGGGRRHHLGHRRRAGGGAGQHQDAARDDSQISHGGRAQVTRCGRSSGPGPSCVVDLETARCVPTTEITVRPRSLATSNRHARLYAGEKGLPNPAECALRHCRHASGAARASADGPSAAAATASRLEAALRDGGWRAPIASAKLARMSEGFFLSCTAAKACAVRSHDQGAWVWRRRS